MSETTEAPKGNVIRLAHLAPSAQSSLQKAIGLPDPNAVQSNTVEPEDEYQRFYAGGAKEAGVLAPPYNLVSLDRLSQENNALSPCIEAMVVNIDGTGYDFEKKDEEAESEEEDSKIDELRAFFAEVWPGTSFTTMRRDLRRDMERTGNGYIECIRNPQDEPVFLRRADSKMTRLMKLDDAVPVAKTVVRRGKEMTVTVNVRERRFVQLLNGVNMVYFKEFGASRDLDKNTGKWAPIGKRLPAKDRASELIHMTILPDAKTPYGVPRWISQLPSVLGSRKAEEFNMEFFDNGGIPPVLIILQGGTLQAETRKALEQKMGGGMTAEKQRAQILEVEPNSGTFDQAAQARVTVERFGGERQSDSMFDSYDDKCEDRVRRAFRLPPIFVGMAGDYSFATAFASYTVAEAQVFKPERDEFDEIISMSILRALDYEDYRIISKPLVIEDVALKLEGLTLAMTTNRVDMEDVIYEINEAVGLNLKVIEEKKAPPITIPGTMTHTVDDDGNIVPIPKTPEQQAAEAAAAGAAVPKPANSNAKVPAKAPAKQQTPASTPVEKSLPRTVLEMAHGALLALRKHDFAALSKSTLEFAALDPAGQSAYREACASLQFVDSTLDPDGLAALAACTISVMARDAHVQKADGTCSCGHKH